MTYLHRAEAHPSKGQGPHALHLSGDNPLYQLSPSQHPRAASLSHTPEALKSNTVFVCAAAKPGSLQDARQPYKYFPFTLSDSPRTLRGDCGQLPERELRV